MFGRTKGLTAQPEALHAIDAIFHPSQLNVRVTLMDLSCQLEIYFRYFSFMKLKKFSQETLS